MGLNSEKKFWDFKPYWCQPWSIITFGILFLLSSWIFFHNLLITSTLFLIVLAWWFLFLILVPRSYDEVSINK